MNKSLYGLKQAFREWNKEFTSKLIEYGFRQSEHDHFLFVKVTRGEFLALVVYVDNVLLIGSDVNQLTKLKAYLHREFTIKDLGATKYFLGFKFHGLKKVFSYPKENMCSIYLWIQD